MELRPYRPADCPVLAQLFYDTVHRVNRKDYTPQQCRAWATGQVDLAEWNRSFLCHCTLVAWEKDAILGFGDMAPEGYLDRLYVRWDRQGEGIGYALCQALEAAVPSARYHTYASLTARPFFLRQGYRVAAENQVLRNGVLLPNFLMEKP